MLITTCKNVTIYDLHLEGFLSKVFVFLGEALRFPPSAPFGTVSKLSEILIR